MAAAAPVRVRTATVIRPGSHPGAPGISTNLAITAAAMLAVTAYFLLLAHWTVSARLERAQFPGSININAAPSPSALAKALENPLEHPGDARFAADRLIGEAARRPLSHVGAAAFLRVTESELRNATDLRFLVKRAADAHGESIPLFERSQLGRVKPYLTVRTAADYRKHFHIAMILVFAPFWIVLAVWWFRGLEPHPLILPATMAGCGIGFATQISLMDPLRDQLRMYDFATGSAIGALLLAAATMINFERWMSTLIPIAAGFGLIALLGIAGDGPTGSKAKVNLFGAQPAVVIVMLFVAGLAAWFSRRYQQLRILMLGRRAILGLSIPRPDDLAPVAAVALSLGAFALIRDNGPALVLGGVILAMYAAARDRWTGVAFGLLAIVAGVWAGLTIWRDEMPLVAGRFAAWGNAWENAVRGGDQVAQFLWAICAGAFRGQGMGLGYGSVIHNAHTDGVIPAFAEDAGFPGFLLIIAIFAALLHAGFHAASRACSVYQSLLAFGLTVLLGWQASLIMGGVLGVLPLSGVATPFLSYGRSATIAFLAAVGVIASISARGGSRETAGLEFVRPMRWASNGFAALGALFVLTAGWYQTWAADDITLRIAKTRSWTAPQQVMVENPRLAILRRMIERGDIVDRNGKPVVTVDEKGRRKNLMMSLYHVTGSREWRFHEVRANRQVESRLDTTLTGFEDARELLPLLRHRNNPDHPAVRALLDRDRSVKLTIDADFQNALADAVAAYARTHSYSSIAAVAADPRTGEILATVSYPWPADNGAPETASLRDMVNVELAAPGSIFKPVVAMAWFRHNSGPAPEYRCVRLTRGRVGARIDGVAKPVQDDRQDKTPHGDVDLIEGTTHSCNGYFAQLCVLGVGPRNLRETAGLFGMLIPESITRGELAMIGYGQSKIAVTPLQALAVQMAIANDGTLIRPHHLANEHPDPIRVIAPEQARLIARGERSVVERGTGRAFRRVEPAMIAKTGTAENPGHKSNAWFVGSAPHTGNPAERKIAFAVLVPDSGYGATHAGPLAAELVRIAKSAAIIR